MPNATGRRAWGWGLPEFHSLALGKHCVGLHAHSHKEWMNEENSVLVPPNGKIEAYDNMFFHPGRPFNQGSIYDFDQDVFLAACDKAIEKVKTNKVNQAGLDLQKKFTIENTVDKILKVMESV